MTPGKAIATATLIGVTAITIGDAPNWRVEPYIGLLAAMSGVSVVGQVAPDLAVGMAGLITAVMILQRGEALTAAVTRWFT